MHTNLYRLAGDCRCFAKLVLSEVENSVCILYDSYHLFGPLFAHPVFLVSNSIFLAPLKTHSSELFVRHTNRMTWKLW